MWASKCKLSKESETKKIEPIPFEAVPVSPSLDLRNDRAIRGLEICPPDAKQSIE